VPGSAREEREQALERAVRALGRRDHSAASLRAKLERAGISETTQEETVETLARAGYLDDERFALERAARLAERGYGNDRIRADLEARGVAAEACQRALAALEPERDRAFRHARTLGRSARAVRTLQRRGFSEEALEAVLAESVAEDPRPGVG
jgi:regulatory protein